MGDREFCATEAVTVDEAAAEVLKRAAQIATDDELKAMRHFLRFKKQLDEQAEICDRLHQHSELLVAAVRRYDAGWQPEWKPEE